MMLVKQLDICQALSQTYREAPVFLGSLNVPLSVPLRSNSAVFLSHSPTGDTLSKMGQDRVFPTLYN